MVVVAAVGAAALWVTAVPVEAKGTLLHPVRDRYEPGDTVTLVGYTTLARVDEVRDEGPFQAYLQVDDSPTSFDPPDIHDPDDLRVGSLELQDTKTLDGMAMRVSLSFRLPHDLAPGNYDILPCNVRCTSMGPADVIGGTIYVGVDPSADIVRYWPPQEPAMGELADDALVHYGDKIVPASNLRAAGLIPGPDDAPEVQGRADQSSAGPVSSATANREDADSDDESATATAAADDDTQGNGEVALWLAVLGVLVVGWCAAWRLERHGSRATSATSPGIALQVDDRPTDDDHGAADVGRGA